MLLALRGFLGCGRTRAAIVLYLALLAFLLSVGINGAFLGICFLLAYTFITPMGSLTGRAHVVTLLLLAFLAVHPHWVEFGRLALSSARLGLDVTGLYVVPQKDLLWSLLFLDRSSATRGFSIYPSWPLLGFAILGIARREPLFHGKPQPAAENSRPPNDPDGTKPELRRLALVLGFVPFLIVLLCRLDPTLPASIPGFRAVHWIRLLWFSNVFLNLAVGSGLEWVRQTKIFGRGLSPVVFAAALLLVLQPRYQMFRLQADGISAFQHDTLFVPERLLTLMEPYTRLASNRDPSLEGHDFKSSRRSVLGSAGRSIVLDRSFKEYLLRSGLIKGGWKYMTYCFQPGRPELLSRFGIRYFVTSDSAELLREWGWIPIARKAGFTLFKNPEPVTPVYVAGLKPEFVQNYEIDGNDIRVQLPARRNYDLVATFLARPGWKAFVDGKPAAIRKDPDHFIHVFVNGGRRLLLRYEPFSNLYLLASFGASLLSAGGFSLAISSGRRACGTGDTTV